MNFDEIDNLNPETVIALYNDIIDFGNNFISTTAAGACADGTEIPHGGPNYSFAYNSPCRDVLADIYNKCVQQGHPGQPRALTVCYHWMCWTRGHNGASTNGCDRGITPHPNYPCPIYIVN